MLHSLVKTGDKYRNPSKSKKIIEKLADVSDFLIKHDKVLNIERNLFGRISKEDSAEKQEKILIFRFHRFVIGLSKEFI